MYAYKHTSIVVSLVFKFGIRIEEFKMTKAEIEKAFSMWGFKTDLFLADERLNDFLNIKSNKNNWISFMRKFKQFSLAQVAEKMNITRGTVNNVEKAELKGKITLEKMKQIAEAMDCEFVYAIRPKDKKMPSETIWNEVIDEALKHVWLKKCAPKSKSRALVAVVNKTLNNHEFRQKKKWSYRKFEPEKTGTTI
jgi:transcriptional regulator with XRE-family HTH domain